MTLYKLFALKIQYSSLVIGENKGLSVFHTPTPTTKEEPSPEEFLHGFSLNSFAEMMPADPCIELSIYTGVANKPLYVANLSTIEAPVLKSFKERIRVYLYVTLPPFVPSYYKHQEDK